MVEQSGHSRKALYNILTAALSKHDEAGRMLIQLHHYLKCQRCIV